LFFPNETKVEHHGGDDWERASGWSEEERRTASTRAKQLVSDYRAAIRKVADELLASRIALVSGERISQIVKEKSPYR
jgi:hypothetical protein